MQHPQLVPPLQTPTPCTHNTHTHTHTTQHSLRRFSDVRAGQAPASNAAANAFPPSGPSSFTEVNKQGKGYGVKTKEEAHTSKTAKLVPTQPYAGVPPAHSSHSNMQHPLLVPPLQTPTPCTHNTHTHHTTQNSHARFSDVRAGQASASNAAANALPPSGPSSLSEVNKQAKGHGVKTKNNAH